MVQRKVATRRAYVVTKAGAVMEGMALSESDQRPVARRMVGAPAGADSATKARMACM